MSLLYVTGTNTGVGKTTLAALLLEEARRRGRRVGAMKPFCSGGRDDAVRLHALQTGGLTLDEVNPFHFEEPLAPLLAARRAGKSVTREQTLAAINSIRRDQIPLLIEGAGGLLSPLGEGFSLLDMIKAVPGKVCIVGGNVLGVLNLARLTSEALPIPQADQAIVLMNPEKSDESTPHNAGLLREIIPGCLVTEIPFLNDPRTRIRAVDEIFSWWID